jgi:hypothetical protein
VFVQCELPAMARLTSSEDSVVLCIGRVQSIELDEIVVSAPAHDKAKPGLSLQRVALNSEKDNKLACSALDVSFP